MMEEDKRAERRRQTKRRVSLASISNQLRAISQNQDSGLSRVFQICWLN